MSVIIDLSKYRNALLSRLEVRIYTDFRLYSMVAPGVIIKFNRSAGCYLDTHSGCMLQYLGDILITTIMQLEANF